MAIELELPEEFYRSEYRCGYYVSEKRKQIWAVELDLLKKFADVCEANGLRYFMDGGTLLGATRHKGFIPWDDDVDVNMPRKDYNRLLEIAGDVFQEPYCLQTTLSVPGFFRAHAQLRNSSTTGVIVKDMNKEQINKGIWLDIFILDNIPDGYLAKRRQKRRVEKTMLLLKMKYNIPPDGKARGYYRHHSFEELYSYFDKKVLGGYQDKDTKWFGNMTIRWQSNWMWPKSYFQSYCYLPFECLSLRAPLFYHEVMERQYGKDYMEFPEGYRDFPIEPGLGTGSTHGSTFFDPNTPYREYDFTALLAEIEKQNT